VTNAVEAIGLAPSLNQPHDKTLHSALHDAYYPMLICFLVSVLNQESHREISKFPLNVLVPSSLFPINQSINHLFLMKAFFFVSSIIVAFFSIAYKDSIISHFEAISTSFQNTTFEGLPVFPPFNIYGAPKPVNMTIPRAIRKAFLAIEQAEGAGATVRRSIGTPQLKNFSPFLMLDHFTIKPGAGFPDHPHRGQETVCANLL
jgi:hypothetical protein